MIAVDLPVEIEARLRELAGRSGLTTEDIAREALLDLLSDLEDGAIALERLARPLPGIPLEQIEGDLGLGR